MANIHELIKNFTDAVHTRGMALRQESMEWKRRAKTARSDNVRDIFQFMSKKAAKDADELLNATKSLDEKIDTHKQN